MKKRILVLLSTYNGEEFIEEQIQSILWQEDVHVFLLIRDDGSTDKTIDIITEFMNRYSNIRLIRGENVGINKSFYELTTVARDEIDYYDFYAFADQDDVWEKNKLSVAIGYLSKMDASLPNLYYSNLKLVDKNLNFIGNLYRRNYVKNTKTQALVSLPELKYSITPV